MSMAGRGCLGVEMIVMREFLSGVWGGGDGGRLTGTGFSMIGANSLGRARYLMRRMFW